MAEETARCELKVDQIVAETAKLAFVNMDEDDDPFIVVHHKGLEGRPPGFHSRRGGRERQGGKVRIKINPGKLGAVVKLSQHPHLFKGDAGQGDRGRHRLCRTRHAGTDAGREAGGDYGRRLEQSGRMDPMKTRREQDAVKRAADRDYAAGRSTTKRLKKDQSRYK
jgi:hypothetical protein